MISATNNNNRWVLQTIDTGDAAALCFDANEEHVLVGTATGAVQLWNLRDQQRTQPGCTGTHTQPP